MTISYPRAMPSGGARVASVVFEIDWQTAHNPEAGGRIGAVTLAMPLWRAEIESTQLIEPHTGEWRAWLRSMRGGARTFIAVDPSKRLPLAYPNGFAGLVRAGGGAFDGTVDGGGDWSVDSTRTQLTLTRLPAGFVLGASDLVGFVWDGVKRALCACEETVAANGAGALTVQVAPPLPAFVPSTATVTLADAGCIMKIRPGTIDGPRVRAGNRTTTRFAALEHPQA